MHNEVVLDDQTHQAVTKTFPSFKDFMNLVCHHSKWGYYNQDKRNVGLEKDFGTYPMALSPLFGRMLAEQAFIVWNQMVDSDDLSKGEDFSFVEFGAGTGQLAYDFLDHVSVKAEADKEWRHFKKVLKYKIVELSPKLKERQEKLNERFGELTVISGDARKLDAVKEIQGIKGIFFSNELISAFGGHKVLFNPSGEIEAAFVIPSINRAFFDLIKKQKKEQKMPDHKIFAQVERSDLALRSQFGLEDKGDVYLDQATFIAVMDYASDELPDQYQEFVYMLRFNETYIPVKHIPELVAYLPDHLHEYAVGLLTSGKSFVAYPSPESADFVRGMSNALKKGYHMTIDYSFSLVSAFLYLRKIEMEGLARDWDMLRTIQMGKFASKPYAKITLQDQTIDTNNTVVVIDGEKVDLNFVQIGFQVDLSGEVLVNMESLVKARVEQFKRELALSNFSQVTSAFLKKMVKEKPDPEELIEALIPLFPKEFDVIEGASAAEVLKPVIRNILSMTEHRLGTVFPLFVDQIRSLKARLLQKNFRDKIEKALVLLLEEIIKKRSKYWIENFALADFAIRPNGFKILIQKKKGTNADYKLPVERGRFLFWEDLFNLAPILRPAESDVKALTSRLLKSLNPLSANHGGIPAPSLAIANSI